MKSLNDWREELKTKLKIQQIDISYVKNLLKKLNYTKLNRLESQKKDAQKNVSFVRDITKKDAEKTIIENKNQLNYYY